MNRQITFTPRLLALAVLAAPLAGALAAGSGFIAPAVAQTAAAAQAAAPISVLYGALEKSQALPSPEARAAIVGPAVDQAFNLDTILKRSIGLHYAQLTPDERTQLLQAFRRFTVARYVSSFKPGSEAVFSILPNAAPNPTGGVLIDTTIRGRTDSPANATPLNYVMTPTPQGWRITDILLNGHISQTATQRSDFRSVIDQSGAAGLIRTLNKKADGLLHG
ncbi:ABC transporter substrate-binding protein [Oecophyllibacter saccharovorans]|nr:ABC transporter substrate-binding protein [Oecophyllibacter saccharovorans]